MKNLYKELEPNVIKFLEAAIEASGLIKPNHQIIIHNYSCHGVYYSYDPQTSGISYYGHINVPWDQLPDETDWDEKLAAYVKYLKETYGAGYEKHKKIAQWKKDITESEAYKGLKSYGVDVNFSISNLEFLYTSFYNHYSKKVE